MIWIYWGFVAASLIILVAAIIISIRTHRLNNETERLNNDTIAKLQILINNQNRNR